MTATIWLLIILILLVMGDIIFVKPGHYRRKGERPDGHEDMIRVLGPDPKNDSKWITNRGSMSDSEIKDKYEPFDTTTSEQPVKRSRPVIGDLNAPPSRRQSKPQPQPQTPQPQTAPQQTTQPQTLPQQPEQPQQQYIQPQQDTLEQQILTKCITSQHQITLTIPLTTTLDLHKLISSISMLGLDEDTLAEAILNSIPQPDIIQGIKNLFHTDPSTQQPLQPTVPEVYVQLRNLLYENNQDLKDFITRKIEENKIDTSSSLVDLKQEKLTNTEEISDDSTRVIQPEVVQQQSQQPPQTEHYSRKEDIQKFIDKIDKDLEQYK